MSTRGGFARAYVPKEHPIHAYRQSIAVAAKEAGLKPTDAEMLVACKFVFARPKSHSNKSGLKEDAPRFPKCDCDNLAKGVLDALNGIAFDDDSQVTQLFITKAYGVTAYTEVLIDIVP